MIDFDGTVLAAAQASFGQAVTYFADGSAEPISIIGIFDDRWVDARFTGTPLTEVITVRPILDVRASQMPQAPAQGDQVQVGDRLYLVAEPPEPDTFGSIRLYLRYADDTQALAP